MVFLPAFVSNHTFFLIVILGFAIILLWKGAELLVDAACSIATRLAISPLVIGLSIVAIGTSAPEFAVSIQAALEDNPEIAIGNIFGSNIFNLGFILGLGAIFGKITTNRQTVYVAGGFLIFCASLLYLFSFGLPSLKFTKGYLSTTFSFVLILLLIGYIFFLYYQKKTTTVKIYTKKFHWKDILWLIFGLACIILGGHYLVESSSRLGEQVGLSNWIIGITIVAIGTSSPELATTLMAIAKKKQSLAIGNLLGSDLFNILGVIGVTGLVGKGIVMSQITNFSLTILLLNLLVVVLLMRTNWQLSRLEGCFLVLISFARYILDFSYNANF